MAAQPFCLRLGFEKYLDEIEMVEEQLITNRKTGEELSLAIIDDDGYDDGELCKLLHMVEIKRTRTYK